MEQVWYWKTRLWFVEQEAIAKKIAKEKAKLETLKQEEEVNNIIIETELQTKEVKTINIHK